MSIFPSDPAKEGTTMRFLMYCSGISVILLLGIMLWALGDLHNRIHIAMLAQIPALLFMAIRKAMR